MHLRAVAEVEPDRLHHLEGGSDHAGVLRARADQAKWLTWQTI
jgi:hypothetical protein